MGGKYNHADMQCLVLLEEEQGTCRMLAAAEHKALGVLLLSRVDLLDDMRPLLSLKRQSGSRAGQWRHEGRNVHRRCQC